MTIIDTATVSALFIVLAVAVLPAVVTFSVIVWKWVAAQPARPVRRPTFAVRPAH